MKLFAVRDESDKMKRDLAYLIYYETHGRFYIELPDDADAWNTPLLLSSFAEKGIKTVNSYWSRLWVQQRIVPVDRQNLGQILKENRLKEYDEYALLMLGKGRCAQDDYRLVPLTWDDLPEQVRSRFDMHLSDMYPLENYRMLLFFNDGMARITELHDYF